MKNENEIFKNMDKIELFKKIKSICNLNIKKLKLQNFVLKEIITKENLKYTISGNVIFLFFQNQSMVLDKNLFSYLLNLLKINKKEYIEYGI